MCVYECLNMYRHTCLCGHALHLCVPVETQYWHQELSSIAPWLIHWVRVSQLNPELLDQATLARQLVLGNLCLCSLNTWITGDCRSTWHLHGCQGPELQSSHVYKKHSLYQAISQPSFSDSCDDWFSATSTESHIFLAESQESSKVFTGDVKNNRFVDC